MSQPQSMKEVFAFAIQEEERASVFYQAMAKKVDNEVLKIIFRHFAEEELEHKRKLQDMEKRAELIPVQQKIVLSEIAAKEDHNLVNHAAMDLQDAFLLAMRKEKEAFILYTHWSEITQDESMKRILELLSQEEAKHRMRLEIEYDQRFQADN